MRKEVEIVNKLGLHARPAALFVRCVVRFKSTITIWKGEENFSAASLLEVLTANLDCGARVVLEAVGPDEPEALSELEAQRGKTAGPLRALLDALTLESGKSSSIGPVKTFVSPGAK